MFKNIVHWTRVDPAPLGRVTLEGTEPSEPLSVPMCILSLVHELEDAGIQTPDLAEIRTWAVSSIKLHIQRDGTRVLENVSPDGKQVQGSAGRLMNPGIVKIMSLYIILLCTHLHHTSFQYLSNTCNAFNPCYIRRKNM